MGPAEPTQTAPVLLRLYQELVHTEVSASCCSVLTPGCPHAPRPISPWTCEPLSAAPAPGSTVTLSPGCGAGAAARQGRAVSGAAMVSSSPRGLGGSSRAPLRFGGQH